MIARASQWSLATPGRLNRPGPEEVHVWRVSLEATAAQMECLFRTLSPDEIERARLFRFEKDQKQFITARGMLRRILGYYVREHPQQLHFQYSSYGKPALAPEYGALHFNVSHAGAWALYAVASDREVGVDIECIRDDIDLEQISRQFFSSGEIRWLEQAEQSKRRELFFQLWTRKEAFIKATGKGMSFPLEQVDVSSGRSDNWSPVHLFADAGESGAWQVQNLFPAHGYTAAVAIEGSNCGLFCWRHPI